MGFTSKSKKNKNKYETIKYFEQYLKRIKIPLSEEQLDSFNTLTDIYFYFKYLKEELEWDNYKYNSYVIKELESYLKSYEPEDIFELLIEDGAIPLEIQKDEKFVSFKIWKRKLKIKWILG